MKLHSLKINNVLPLAKKSIAKKGIEQDTWSRLQYKEKYRLADQELYWNLRYISNIRYFIYWPVGRDYTQAKIHVTTPSQ